MTYPPGYSVGAEGFLHLDAMARLGEAVRADRIGCPCDDHSELRADDYYAALAAVLAERAPA